MRKFRKARKIDRESGAAMLIVMVFFLFIMLAIISGLVSPSVREFTNARDAVRSRQSEYLSESGLEDAYYRLKSAQPIGSSVTLAIHGHTATTTVSDSGYNEKTISSLGDVDLRQRRNEIVLMTGDGASFNYGIQAGVGGFEMGNAIVHGNVYSNGTVVGANGALVTGSVFSAGAGGLIDNVDVGQAGSGDARANTVQGSVVAGNLYCKTGSGNNKPCNTSAENPSPVPMPLTEQIMNEWKADAELGGITTGNVTISTPTSLGPRKITGNLAINANLTITGTIYVMGNITTANGAQVRLSSSYGPTGGIIITDGRVTLSNNAMFYGSGSSGTYVLLVTTSSCPTNCAGQNAFEILNNVGAILISAQNGTVHLNNNVELSEVVGNKIILDNNVEITYISGLANTSFTSGPSGGWQVKTWKEVP